MQSRLFGVIFFSHSLFTCLQCSPCYFLRIHCSHSHISIHNANTKIMPLSCPSHWSSDQFPCLQPLLVPIIPTVIWTLDLVFLSQLLTLIQCTPYSSHTKLTNFTPISLVPFFGVLHIMFSSFTLLCCSCFLILPDVAQMLPLWDAFSEIKWFLQLVILYWNRWLPLPLLASSFP